MLYGSRENRRSLWPPMIHFGQSLSNYAARTSDCPIVGDFYGYVWFSANQPTIYNSLYFRNKHANVMFLVYQEIWSDMYVMIKHTNFISLQNKVRYILFVNNTYWYVRIFISLQMPSAKMMHQHKAAVLMVSNFYIFIIHHNIHFNEQHIFIHSLKYFCFQDNSHQNLLWTKTIDFDIVLKIWPFTKKIWY